MIVGPVGAGKVSKDMIYVIGMAKPTFEIYVQRKLQMQLMMLVNFLLRILSY